jgi:Exopolyphosphatase-related proteins
MLHDCVMSLVSCQVVSADGAGARRRLALARAAALSAEWLIPFSRARMEESDMSRERKTLAEVSAKNDVRTMSKAAEMAALLEQHRGERHAIVMQDYPDPDAISSAWAHKLIAARFNIDADIIYEGRISHQENLALVQLTDIEMVRYGDGTDLSVYQGTIFVDNQGTTSTLTDRFTAAGVKPLIVVDHHERQDIIDPEFTDIRKIGATATIYTQYMREGLLELNKSDLHHVRLATALMHGIRSETLGLIRAREEELEAATFLTRFTDFSLLENILSVKRSKQVMDVIRQALENREIRESYSISGVGFLRMEDRDSIPQAADFLLYRREYPHRHRLRHHHQRRPRNGRRVHAHQQGDLEPGRVLERGARGRPKPDAIMAAGGAAPAALEIPIGFLAAIKDDELVRMKWRLYDELIKRKLFAKIGVPSVIRSDSSRDTGTLPGNSLRVEEV